MNCILLAPLVRVDIGDSVAGEKYESPTRGPGEPAPCGGPAPVCKLSPFGGWGRGNLGGGARFMPAIDCVLSPVAERDLKLVLDALRVMPRTRHEEDWVWKVFATGPPCWPVAPRTTMSLWGGIGACADSSLGSRRGVVECRYEGSGKRFSIRSLKS